MKDSQTPMIAGDQTAPAINSRPEPLGMNPKETAIVVVDMQNAYSTKGGYVDLCGFDVSGTRSVIQNISDTVDLAHQLGMPVVFLQNGWDPELKEAGGEGSPNWYKSNALKLMREKPELKGQLLAKGGWDYALVDELTPGPEDILLPKTRYSGFWNTQLNSILRARGIKNIVFCGIATNVCVETSIRDAFHNEFFAVLLEDACHQLGDDMIRAASIYNIETFFGWVATCADFAEYVALTQKETTA
ncbi:isochorismatase family protein [Celeribacter halophilus]|uniref:isochorismatase family protein n=1 Tax=Celeribacter halophilus TaxID=576117 RepID=UPI0020914FAB|nr:isochorismatase family protein [Celeribacter halophilus]MDO6512382.1 isochorismatase family protein [Celeribacter halophilus]